MGNLFPTHWHHVALPAFRLTKPYTWNEYGFIIEELVGDTELENCLD